MSIPNTSNSGNVTTADTYLVRNIGATTVSWFARPGKVCARRAGVDGVELAVLKKQTEVR